jgi:hypothetical protein
MKITGQKLTIFDPLDDVSDTEVALIAKYLYNEGFFKKKDIKIVITNEPIN